MDWHRASAIFAAASAGVSRISVSRGTAAHAGPCRREPPGETPEKVAPARGPCRPAPFDSPSCRSSAKFLAQNLLLAVGLLLRPRRECGGCTCCGEVAVSVYAYTQQKTAETTAVNIARARACFPTGRRTARRSSITCASGRRHGRLYCRRQGIRQRPRSRGRVRIAERIRRPRKARLAACWRRSSRSRPGALEGGADSTAGSGPSIAATSTTPCGTSGRSCTGSRPISAPARSTPRPGSTPPRCSSAGSAPPH